jgi:NADPH2:quinone reductase
VHRGAVALSGWTNEEEPMQASIPAQMRAAAFDRYGGPEVLHAETLPVPQPGSKEVLIRLDSAGIGAWDPYVRSGEVELGRRGFPRIIGNDGAGEVVAVGDGARRFRVGDRVYAYSFEAGFYAEYAAVKEDDVAPIPRGLSAEEAGVLGADGVTAVRGLDDQLHLAAGQTLLVYGASGGIGHLAVQLAKRIGARVLAVASERDGVELARRLGADAAVDGKRDDVARAARDFAPGGLDAALVLVHGESLDPALSAMRKGGRIAHPNGVEPAPTAPPGVTLLAYDGEPGRDAFERLDRLISAGPFHVELGRVYALEDAARAHREIGQHHLGKLALRIH